MQMWVSKEPPPSDEWIWCNSPREAIYHLLTNGCPDRLHVFDNLNTPYDAFDLIKFVVREDGDYGGRFIPRKFRFVFHSRDKVRENDGNAYIREYLQ